MRLTSTGGGTQLLEPLLNISHDCNGPLQAEYVRLCEGSVQWEEWYQSAWYSTVEAVVDRASKWRGQSSELEAGDASRKFRELTRLISRPMTRGSLAGKVGDACRGGLCGEREIFRNAKSMFLGT